MKATAVCECCRWFIIGETDENIFLLNVKVTIIIENTEIKI